MIIELRRRKSYDNNLLSTVNISPLLKQLYIKRGICTVKELDRSTKSLLSYHALNGIEKAVDLIIYALFNNYKIVVVGDFDVDGASSTALLIIALRRMGAKSVDFLIPDRFQDGYGLSPSIVEKAKIKGAQLIITVDNGINSYEGVILANEKNIPVIITDHHIPNDMLPKADVIINPNLRNCNFMSKSLAGVGVAFYLMCALRSKLIINNWFIDKKIMIPNLAELLDLVALGTVLDVVSLDTNNRILVHQGLNRIRAGYCRLGIYILAKMSNCNINRLCTSDLSFTIGPKINSAGRLDNMSKGVELLLTDDLVQAKKLALKLVRLNNIRKKISKKMENRAITLYKKSKEKLKSIPVSLIFYDNKWHQGIIGIIASRIKDRFYRPVIVFAPSKNGILKGSGRSIVGFNMYRLIEKIDNSYPGLILKFGGHDMAIGLTIEFKKLSKFCKYFKIFSDKLINPLILKNIVWSDGELSDNDLSLNTAKLLYNGGPWGKDFPEPSFDGKFVILKQKEFGKNNLRLLLRSSKSKTMLNGIAFNVDPIFLSKKNIYTVKIVYQLKIDSNYCNSDNLLLLIQHIWLI